MVGAGKTTVGAALATRLDLAFVDTDAEIVRGAGMSIPEIFRREGEVGFRKREREAVESVAGESAVVALGGGALAQPGLCERCETTGTIVYLRARLETLLARVGRAEDRPLLAGLAAEERRAKLESLLAEREAIYERARLVIDTDGSRPERLVDELARELAR